MNRLKVLRGINPLIVTIILIAAAVIAGVIFMGFATGFIGAQTRVPQIGVKSTNFIETQNKVIVEVGIRNFGSGEATIISVTLVDPNTQSELGELTSEMGVVTLKAGDEATFTGYFDKTRLVRGETYLIKIQYKIGSRIDTKTVSITYASP